jgi:hypothetical protein
MADGLLGRGLLPHLPDQLIFAFLVAVCVEFLCHVGF